MEQAQLRRFTREEFQRMIELGLFSDDEHLELLHGRLVVVPPQGPPQAYSTTLLRQRLVTTYAPGRLVREEKPLDCGRDHLPEPDLAVVRGALSDYASRHPRGDESVLVVEVSRTTQAVDRDKASIYAGAAVPVYWLLDLKDRRLEEHSGPVGNRYSLLRILSEGDEVSVPQTDERWVVGDLLPPP